MAKIKSQEAAFRDARKPKPKPKTPHVNNVATPKGVSKNAARNERRKAARKTAMLLKSQGMSVAKKGKKKDDAEEKVDDKDGKKIESVDADSKMDVEEEANESDSSSSD